MEIKFGIIKSPQERYPLQFCAQVTQEDVEEHRAKNGTLQKPTSEGSLVWCNPLCLSQLLTHSMMCLSIYVLDVLSRRETVRFVYCERLYVDLYRNPKMLYTLPLLDQLCGLPCRAMNSGLINRTFLS